MAGERKKSVRFPQVQGVFVWAAITGLLALGILTTLMDLSALPVAEATRANEQRQRFVINAKTGEISLSDTSPDAAATPPSEFDVASEAETQAPADATPEVAATTPPEAAATEAPASDATAAAEPAPAPVAQPETAPLEEPTLPENTPRLRTTPLPNDAAIPAQSKKSLVAAPAPEVTETVDGLRIPKRGANDITPANLYAHRFSRKPEQILISFLVIDAGIDPQSVGLLMALPPQISIAYSPYSRAQTNFSEQLRNVGHEAWTMLPTMNDRYPNDDPGPLGIIGQMPSEEVLRRTKLLMGAIAGSVGFVMPPDETVSLHAGTLGPAIAEISGRGLRLFATHPTHSIAQLSTTKGIEEIIRRADLNLDPTPDEAQIRSKLAGILEAAKAKGEYSVILTARPQSLQLLAEWLKQTNLTKPYALAPLSALYLPKEAPVAAAPADDGHGGGHGGAEKKKEKAKPKEKKKKPLIQDQYKQPAEGAKDAGHGGGH
jgi:hypothetical protein